MCSARTSHRGGQDPAVGKLSPRPGQAWWLTSRVWVWVRGTYPGGQFGMSGKSCGSRETRVAAPKKHGTQAKDPWVWGPLPMRSGAPDRLEACAAFAVRRPLAEKTVGAADSVAPPGARSGWWTPARRAARPTTALQSQRLKSQPRRPGEKPIGKRRNGCRKSGLTPTFPAATHTHVRERWGADGSHTARRALRVRLGRLPG